MTVADKIYAATPAHRIAFIGLGTMGAPMAAHLLRAGHTVTVFNRTAAKAQSWVVAHGGAMAATPAEAAQGASIVVTCVGNDDDLREVTVGAQGAFQSMMPGGVLVDHTTTSAEVARELAQRAAQQGLAFIDAPVSGGNLGAINGVLTVMCGGDAEAFARVQPVITAYAKAVTLLGESGAGQLAKMVNQIAVGGLLQGLAEALAFGQKAGLDMSQVLQVISQGAASSWQMVNRGPTMIDDQFDFGFAVDWMRKDLGLVLDEGRRMGARLPVTALIDQFYADVQAMGGGRLDTSSLIKRLR
ncbi:NAD(P)-dependent oxidoreductase [Aquabacterium sp.]|uniref:NAD(P)-dependent oxidoreductase n=1 Tax=Aquabacterium sp. TaxID=1872578 RepID=UPI003B6DE72A